MTSDELPSVSVIMATYHGDALEHLQQSVDSILRQSVTEFEYLIAIDGPVSEPTMAYLKSITDKRVKLLPLEHNGGPARARNYAIKHAGGCYLLIQDADDISADDRIEKQKAFLEANNYDLVSSCVNEIDDEGEVVKRKPYPEDEKKIIRMMPFINTINNSAVFCRAELLKSIPYEEKMRFGEDYRTWIRAIAQGKRLGNHGDYLVSYRLASSRRRGWKTAKIDLSIKLASLRIAKWYLWPAVIGVAFATAGVRMIPAKMIIYVYRLKEFLLPKLAKY